MLQGVDKICVGAGGSKHTCWYLALAFKMGREGRRKEGRGRMRGRQNSHIHYLIKESLLFFLFFFLPCPLPPPIFSTKAEQHGKSCIQSLAYSRHPINTDCVNK